MNRSRHLGGLYARPAAEPFEPVEHWERPRLLAELKRLGERIEDFAAPSLGGFGVDHSAELARLRKHRDRVERALRRHDRGRIDVNAGAMQGSAGNAQPAPRGSAAEPGLALPPGDPMAAKAMPAEMPAPTEAPLWLGAVEQRRIRLAQLLAEPDGVPRRLALRFGFSAEYSLETAHTATAGTWRKLVLMHQRHRPDQVQLGAVMREFGFRDRLSDHTLWYGRRSKGGGSITVIEWIAAAEPSPDEVLADPEQQGEEC